MIGRVLIVVAASMAALFAVPAVAGAAPGYPVVTAPATVSASTVDAGGAVTFGGGGFAADSPVSVDVTYLSGGTGQSAPIATRIVQTGRADASGVFTARVRLTAPGVAQLTVTGDKPDFSTLQLTAVVTVLRSGSGSGTSGSGTSGSGTSGSGTSGSGTSGSGTSGSGTSGSGTSGSGTSGSGTSGSGTSGSDGNSTAVVAAGSSSSLPVTGAGNLGMELWLAGGLAALGAAFVSVSVARRRTRA